REPLEGRVQADGDLIEPVDRQPEDAVGSILPVETNTHGALRARRPGDTNRAGRAGRSDRPGGPEESVLPVDAVETHDPHGAGRSRGAWRSGAAGRPRCPRGAGR